MLDFKKISFQGSLHTSTYDRVVISTFSSCAVLFCFWMLLACCDRKSLFFTVCKGKGKWKSGKSKAEWRQVSMFKEGQTIPHQAERRICFYNNGRWWLHFFNDIRFGRNIMQLRCKTIIDASSLFSPILYVLTNFATSPLYMSKRNVIVVQPYHQISNELFKNISKSED